MAQEVKIDQNGKDMLYLIYCALHGQEPDAQRVASMNLEQLFLYGKKHLLGAIIYMALERMEKLPADEVLGRWREYRFKATRKNVMFDAERNKLFSFLDGKGIWYMPLKGSVLKELYPASDMRQMSDIDILFDASFREQVREYFVEQGYQVVAYAKSIHDIYEKQPVFNFEMHTSLFERIYNPVWVEYYDTVKERLLPNVTGSGYHFTDEDFYIYFISHVYKHFDRVGTGIRSFVDCYVYQTAKELDREYIEGELEKLGIADFERVFREASFQLFASRDGVDHLKDEEYEMVCQSMYDGAYGTHKGWVEKSLRRIQADQKPVTNQTKWKYYWSRLIPPMEYYRLYYPVLYKWKVFIPFFVVYRIFRGMILRGRDLLKEIAIVWRLKQ